MNKYAKLKEWWERVQGREAKRRAVEKGGKMDLVYFGSKG